MKLPFLSARRLSAASLGLLALAAAPAARAELIYGVTNVATPVLVSFDSNAPATVTTIGATVAGLRSVDFRPSNGLLYGATYAGATGTFQLYTLSLTTGAPTAVGAAIILPNFQNTLNLSIDVNPMADALRVVTDNGSSYRINLNTGVLVAQDTTFSPTGVYTSTAYGNNVRGATSTTLYAYNSTTNTIGVVAPPNDGVFTPRAAGTGITAPETVVAFDVSGLTGTGYLATGVNAAVVDNLYTVNLTTGTAALVGTTGQNLLDISVVPEPGTWAMLTVGAVTAGAGVLRRRRA